MVALTKSRVIRRGDLVRQWTLETFGSTTACRNNFFTDHDF